MEHQEIAKHLREHGDKCHSLAKELEELPKEAFHKIESEIKEGADDEEDIF